MNENRRHKLAIKSIAKKAALAFVSILLISILIAWGLACYWLSNDMAGWVQAVGAILAIVTGFAAVYYQQLSETIEEETTRATNARAALLIATHACKTVGEPLDAILADEDAKHPFMLRGHRTTEMVDSLRQFDTARLPPHLLEDFLRLRSNLYAMNERISDVYANEKRPSKARKRSDRATDLSGALAVWPTTKDILKRLRNALVAEGETDLPEPLGPYDFESRLPATSP